MFSLVHQQSISSGKEQNNPSIFSFQIVFWQPESPMTHKRTLSTSFFYGDWKFYRETHYSFKQHKCIEQAYELATIPRIEKIIDGQSLFNITHLQVIQDRSKQLYIAKNLSTGAQN